MNKAELVKLLSLGESRFVDLQKTYDPSAICQRVCSFLNTKGGFVICGEGSRAALEQVKSWEKEIKLKIETEKRRN